MTQSVTELVTGGEFGLVLVILVLFIAFQVWLRVSQYFGRRRRSNAEQEALNYELMDAAENGRLEDIASLIGSGADINAVDVVGWTPLIYGAENAGSVALLLRLGADVHAKATRHGSSSWVGFTALHNAVLYDNVEAVRLLAAAGADVDGRAACYDNKTSLLIAAKLAAVLFCNCFAAFEALLDLGANTDLTDGNGVTVDALLGDSFRPDLVGRLQDARQAQHRPLLTPATAMSL